MKKCHIVNLPDIGEGVVEGEVIQWLKQVGDSVLEDEPVVIVMTDKATVELPAPVKGKIKKHYYQAGEIAIKDQPLYEIEENEEIEIDEKVIPQEIEPKIEPKRKNKSLPTFIEKTKDQGDHALAIPHVRKMAKEFGIDINEVKGTGKEGRVTIEDLKNFIQAFDQPKWMEHPLHLPGDREEPLIGIKNLMAKKMMESKEHIPHFSFFEQLDATRLVKLKQKYKEQALKEGINVTYMPFILRALSLALKDFPEVNSSFDMTHNKLIIHEPHHIGIAISTPFGLIVPVLKNVDKMSLNDLIRSYEDLKSRALSNKLSKDEMKDSTITVTNFGVFGGGVEFATPIINYPEVAILGVARIQKEPAVKDDKVIIRDTLHLSWSFDHRVIDGDLAASVSHQLVTYLQNPASLL